jgi:hypothetical protein
MMIVSNIDERELEQGGAEAVFIVYLYEFHDFEDWTKKPNSVDVFVIRDATFVEVMRWISDRLSEGQFQWSLEVMPPDESTRIFVYGGEPWSSPNKRDPLEHRRILESEQVGNRAFTIE